MSAVIRVSFLFCTAGKMQRRGLWAGLLLTVVGAAAMQALYWSPAYMQVLSECVEFVFAMTVVWMLSGSARAFRAASVPRALQLVPYGRLRLLLGMLLAEALIAAFVTVNTTVQHLVSPILPFAAGSLTSRFVGTWAVLSLWGFWIFFAVDAAAWTRWRSCSALCVAAAFLVWSTWFRSEVVGIRVDVFLSLLAAIVSCLFAVWYLRAPLITRPMASTRRIRRIGYTHVVEDIASSRRAVVCIYLLGRASVLSAFKGALIVLVCINVALLSLTIWLGSAHPSAKAGLSATLLATTLLGSGLGSVFAGFMARRSRALWIPGGYTRSEIFATAERLSLRCTAVFGAPLLILVAVECLVVDFDPTKWPCLLLIASTTAVGGVYLGLINVRGQSLSSLAASVWFLLSILVLLPHGPLYSEGPITSRWLVIALAELPAVLIFRYIARQRWERIDWLLCKPARRASRRGFR